MDAGMRCPTLSANTSHSFQFLFQSRHHAIPASATLAISSIRRRRPLPTDIDLDIDRDADSDPPHPHQFLPNPRARQLVCLLRPWKRCARLLHNPIPRATSLPARRRAFGGSGSLPDAPPPCRSMASTSLKSRTPTRRLWEKRAGGRFQINQTATRNGHTLTVPQVPTQVRLQRRRRASRTRQEWRRRSAQYHPLLLRSLAALRPHHLSPSQDLDQIYTRGDVATLAGYVAKQEWSVKGIG